MKDANPRMRIQAIRASETLYKAGDDRSTPTTARWPIDKDIDVVIQAMLTLNYLKAPNVADDRARGAGRQHRPRRAGDRQSDSQAADERVRPRRPRRAAAVHARRARRHGARRGDLQGAVLRLPRRRRPRHRAAGAAPGTTMAPSLANSPRVQGHRDYVIKTLLHGMDGPIDGPVLRRRRHGADGDEPRRVDRRDRVLRAQPLRQRRHVRLAGRRRAGAGGDRGSQDVLESRRARGVAADAARGAADVEGDASHNTATALGALNFASWTTGAPQQPGMWFQIELPEAGDRHRDAVQLGRGRIRGWRDADEAHVPAPAPAGAPPAPVVPAGPYPTQVQG